MDSVRKIITQLIANGRVLVAASTGNTQSLFNSDIVIGLFISIAISTQVVFAADEKIKFKRIQTQFIAALGEPGASAGDGAQHWGLWTKDPGPRGVRLDNYEQLNSAGGVAPAKWQFDNTDWWLEENGLIMEQPAFPLAAGKYLVTGDREVISVLTIHPADNNGDQRWELADGANLFDVTHLGCRSARYTPAAGDNACSPANAPKSAFRVAPGAQMPPVEGCNKQDYAVLFVVGEAIEN